MAELHLVKDSPGHVRVRWSMTVHKVCAHVPLLTTLSRVNIQTHSMCLMHRCSTLHIRSGKKPQNFTDESQLGEE